MLSSNSTRCAACKYLRRRCEKDCILAPYFPPQQPQRFAFVHKVYGAGNIARTLQMKNLIGKNKTTHSIPKGMLKSNFQQIPAEQRRHAVESMVIEAYARVQNPVYGIAGTIHNLLQQIQSLELEIACTHAQIDICTSSSHNANAMQGTPSLPNCHHLQHRHANKVEGEVVDPSNIIGASGSAGFAYLQEQMDQSFLNLPPPFPDM